MFFAQLKPTSLLQKAEKKNLARNRSKIYHTLKELPASCYIHTCLDNDLGLGDFSGFPCFLYAHICLLAKLKGSFVIFHVTPVLFYLAVRQAINFLSKEDITAAWQRCLSRRQKN